jgi:actin cytoskeleton-regulatory complex protein SLA1
MPVTPFSPRFSAQHPPQAAVQKWQTAHVTEVTSEKAKHVQIEIAGPTPISLHFVAGSKDNAEEIMAKTQSSKAIATAGATPASPETSASRRLPPARNVHFDDSSPVIIPPPPAQPEVESEDEEPPQDTGEYASVLYDFTADGEDEMSVKEGEQLLILERDGDDWWKCQNADGHTGMVPASYLEVLLLLS